MTTFTDEKCLQYFTEVISLIKSTNQHQKVLNQIVDRVSRLFKCQTCAVVLIDPKSEYLQIETNQGLSLTFCKAFRTKFATGAIGELLWTGKPLIINDSGMLPKIAEEVKLENTFKSAVCLQISVDHRTLGYFYIDTRDKAEFTKSDITILQNFADMIGLSINKSRLYEENIRLDTIDHETGMEKYTAFLERIIASVERAKDLNEELAILLLDVDNFKAIVNMYGYESSKDFLREMGDLVKKSIRPLDTGARYGFDEFIILSTNTTLDEALVKAKELTSQIQQASFTKQQIKSTVSIGVAAYPNNGRGVEELVTTAKIALFEAQRAGRNKVSYYRTEVHSEGAMIA